MADQPNPVTFRYSTTPFDDNSVVFGLDVTIPMSDTLDLEMHYDGGQGSKNSSHSGALNLVYKF
jgi:uncharacterized protein with beta-barrel porin domain